MPDALRAALLISAIGMGLVFGVILLLWGLIALVVRLGEDRPVASQSDEGRAELAEELDEEADAIAVKAQAAAAAVGAYLAGGRQAP